MSLINISIENQKLIKSRNIVNLIHFTDICNLESILLYGIYPRGKVNSSTAYDYSQRKRLYTSLSIEFPNYMYLNSLRNQYGDKYVILQINIESIFNKAVIVHKSNPYIPRWGEAQTFEDLFFEEYRSKIIPKSYPTDPRAEIELDFIITTNFIEKVIYMEKQFKEIMYIKSKFPNIRYENNLNFFQPRKDYKWWKNIREQGIDVMRVD